MECGQGNILDLIREGRFLTISNQITGSKRLQKVVLTTFLMKKLAIFLEDSTVFFIPKNSMDIITSLRQQKSSLRFSVQEIGIFERMVDQLRLTHEDQEFAIE